MMGKTCDLCGLYVGRHPFTRNFDAAEKIFCCLGCLNVYAILLESGALANGADVRDTELFKRSRALGLISNGEPRAVNPQTPAFELPADAPLQEALLQVNGMWCSSCAWLIEYALLHEPGVVSAEAFFASDLVKVRYCPQYLPPDRLNKRIEQLGYQASAYTGDPEAAHAERRDLLLRLGLAGFLGMNIMTLSMALYVGYFQDISESVRRFLPFLLWALVTPVMFYSGKPILRAAWRGLVNRAVRMETLLALGILAAYVYSIAQAFIGLGGQRVHIYFDTASTIVTLVLVGKVIERNAKEHTTRAISMLYRLMPKKVRLWAEGRERFVAIEALAPGDEFVVKTGERIPADGIVSEGSSHADEALLTGESAPISKDPGSQVVAGSVNLGNVLRIRAAKVGADTTLAQIIKLVEQALASRSELERAVDRISRLFVPAVIVFAVLTFAVCWLGGFTPAGEALLRAITVLVIACPCALGLATPLAVTAAIGAASRQGILVSDSRMLETIRRVDTVIFDKTGTVTEGDFVLLEYAPVLGEVALEGQRGRCGTGGGSDRVGLSLNVALHKVDPVATAPGTAPLSGPNVFHEIHLPLLAALERFSEHPLGQAVVKFAEEHNAVRYDANAVEIHKGTGITGQVAGHRVFIGNRQLAESQSPISSTTYMQRTGDWERRGLTVTYYGWDGEVKGVLAFGDRVKPEAVEVVQQLHQRGIKVLLVSGDAPATTQWVAKAIHADDFRANALPQDKVKVIADLQCEGKVVAMIGDGVNDAPALAQADLSIALGSGADLAMRAASVVLLSQSLQKVLSVFELAQRTWSIVRQNLFWAFLYNTLGLSLAVTGLLNPILAAGAMLLSSLSVIGNTSRLNRSEEQAWGTRNTQK
jgi:cation transport ATPase